MISKLYHIEEGKIVKIWEPQKLLKKKIKMNSRAEKENWLNVLLRSIISVSSVR